MYTSRLLTFKSLFFSIVLHLILGGLLVFSFEFTSKPIPTPKPPANIVKAVSVDKEQVDKELNRLKKKEEEKIKRQKDLEKKAEQAKQKRLEEEKKLKAIEKKKKEQEKKRKAEEVRIKKLEKEKKELEKKRKLEEEKKKKAEEERKRLEAEKKKEAERKKKEAEEKRKAEEERKRKEREKALQEELEAELQAEQEQQDFKEIDRYKRAYQRAIRDEFKTTGLPKGLSCVIRFRLQEDGRVANVAIVKSSGDELFDKRAENAVYAATPLPIPDDARLLTKMRSEDFVIEFTPKY